MKMKYFPKFVVEVFFRCKRESKRGRETFFDLIKQSEAIAYTA